MTIGPDLTDERKTHSCCKIGLFFPTQYNNLLSWNTFGLSKIKKGKVFSIYPLFLFLQKEILKADNFSVFICEID